MLTNKLATPAVTGRPSYIPWLIFAAVVALACGGIGGSVQVSRLFIILLLPFALLRLFQAKTRFQLEVVIFAALLMILSVASLAWSIDPVTTLQYIGVTSVNILPLLMVGLLTPDEVGTLQRILPRAWLLAGAAVLPLAFYELLTGNHFALGFEERGGGGIVDLLPFASGLHGNYNDFSLYLVLCVLGACFYLRERADPPGRGAKAFQVGVIAMLTLVVVINSSRGAIMGLFAALLIRFLWPLRPRSLFFIALIVLVVAGMVLATSENNLLLTYLQLKFSDFSNDLETDEGRLAIMKAGLTGFLDSAGMGVGAGASSSYLATNRAIVIPNPHNLLLEWALNFGVAGLLLFAWFLVRLLVTNNRSGQPVWRRLVNVTVLILPLLGIIQSHLSGYTYFWLMLATISVFAIGADVNTDER